MNIVDKIDIFLNELSSAVLYDKRSFGSKADFEGWVNYKEEKARKSPKKKGESLLIKKLKKKFGLK